MRGVNLLHAHGSPTSYQYDHRGCRCVACRGQKAAKGAAYYATNRADILAHHVADRVAHHAERLAYGAAHREQKAARQRNRRYGLLPGVWEAMLAA